MRTGIAGHQLPTVPGRLVAEEAGRIGGAAGSWPELGRLLADRRDGQGPHDVVRPWSEAQPVPHLLVAVHLRGDTASPSLL